MKFLEKQESVSCGKKTISSLVCYGEDHSQNHLDSGELSFKDQILPQGSISILTYVNPHSCENTCVNLRGNGVKVLLKLREVMVAYM